MTATTHRYVDPIVRSTHMLLISEALARAQYQQRLAEAEHERLALRVAAARRHQRRAERAASRASRASRAGRVWEWVATWVSVLVSSVWLPSRPPSRMCAHSVTG